jgi:hypothetical protein
VPGQHLARQTPPEAVPEDVLEAIVRHPVPGRDLQQPGEAEPTQLLSGERKVRPRRQGVGRGRGLIKPLTEAAQLDAAEGLAVQELRLVKGAEPPRLAFGLVDGRALRGKNGHLLAEPSDRVRLRPEQDLPCLVRQPLAEQGAGKISEGSDPLGVRPVPAKEHRDEGGNLLVLIKRVTRNVPRVPLIQALRQLAHSDLLPHAFGGQRDAQALDGGSGLGEAFCLGGDPRERQEGIVPLCAVP